MYPYEVYAIAEKVERHGFKQVTSWSNMMQFNLPKDHHLDMLYRRAADAIAHEFAGQVLKHMAFQESREPEGHVLKVDTVALRYDELLEVLYKAYAAGQSNGINRSHSLNFREEIGKCA